MVKQLNNLKVCKLQGEEYKHS